MNKWPQNPVIYEINTPVWLYDLSRKYGGDITLANVPAAEWDSLAAFHIDGIWLMGVWERSPMGIQISNRDVTLKGEFRKALPDFADGDNIGSAYCVRQYQVNDLLGGNQGLAAARAALSVRGMRLILDFVPNHTARDHPWVIEHPEYYIHGEIDGLLGKSGYYFESNEEIIACGKDPYFPPWEDCAQLNAFHPGLRLAVIDSIRMIASMCDGVRCDMAMLMLNDIFSHTWTDKAGPIPSEEYWLQVIQSIRDELPDFIFLAEAYWDKELILQQLGFNYCYDKKFYDRLLHDQADSIQGHLKGDIDFQNHLVRFIENHDETRAVSAFPLKKSVIAALAMSTIPGAKLYHDGQFEGRKVKTPVFLRRREIEFPNEDQVRFYQRLVRVATSELIHYGKWSFCELSGWQDNPSFLSLASWTWKKDDQILLVILNFADQKSQGLVRVPWDSVGGNNWRLVDLIKGDIFERSGSEMIETGMYVDLEPWDFHLLWFSRKI